MTDKDLQPIAWLTDLKDGEKCIIANETEVTRIVIAKQPKYGIYPTLPLYTLDQAEEIIKARYDKIINPKQ